MSDVRRVEKLRRDHPVESFDCGREELNRYLVRYAWQNQQAGAAQTYLGIIGEVIVGYHTLAVAGVTLEDVPERLIKGLAKHPVPVRRPRSRGYALWPCMRKMKRPGASTNILILSPPLQIPCISSSCSKMCVVSSRNECGYARGTHSAKPTSLFAQQPQRIDRQRASAKEKDDLVQHGVTKLNSRQFVGIRVLWRLAFFSVCSSVKTLIKNLVF